MEIVIIINVRDFTVVSKLIFDFEGIESRGIREKFPFISLKLGLVGSS